MVRINIKLTAKSYFYIPTLTDSPQIFRFKSFCIKLLQVATPANFLFTCCDVMVIAPSAK